MRNELPINFKICVPMGHLDFIINKLACVFIGDNRELTDNEADFLIIEKNTFKCCNTINFFLDYDAPEITLTHLMNAQPNELLQWSITTTGDITMQDTVKEHEFKEIKEKYDMVNKIEEFLKMKAYIEAFNKGNYSHVKMYATFHGVNFEEKENLFEV